MEAVDKADSALFSLDEIKTPTGWILLSFLMDPRTGLGRFRDFRISNYQLMMVLIDACLECSVEEVLDMPDVVERVTLYREHAVAAQAQLLARSTVHGNLVVLDLREDEVIHPTNRFMIYALHPECNISIHVLWGLKQQNTVFAMGKSIIDRSSAVNVGELMLAYGGGGHEAAGTCQVANAEPTACWLSWSSASPTQRKTTGLPTSLPLQAERHSQGRPMKAAGARGVLLLALGLGAPALFVALLVTSVRRTATTAWRVG